MLEQFTSSIFRHCSPDGWVRHYVFSHAEGNRALRYDWSKLSDLSVARETIEWSRLRPGTVYCPPVGTFTDPSQGTKEVNVAEAPALLVELDDNPTEMRGIAEAILGEATLVVRSGGVTSTGEDKLHLYWRLKQPARSEADRDILKAARGALGVLCEADMSAVPLMHPMRWPGSWHTKGEPRLCEIIAQTENELDLHEAYALLNEIAPTPVRVRRERGDAGFKTPVALSGDDVSRLLGKIDNPDSWADWNKVAMTVWDATHGSGEGLAALHQWSARHAKYDEYGTDARWEHFFDSPPRELSAGSLYHQAGEVAPKAVDPEVAFPPSEAVPGVEVLVEPPLVTAAREAGFGIRTGGTNGIMFASQQIEHFEGCVYVTSLDKVLMPSGQYWSQSKFDARMGGYQFVMDDLGKKTTGSAWEAFLKNPLYTAPVADERCFRPLEPSRSLIDDGSRVLVNTYVPITTPRTKGDPSKWLGWLEKCYPNERDRAILLNYMASVLQNPGRKFFYWPVLQSTEGAGKGLVLELMMFAVGRQYCHLPNTTKMARSGMNFNGWIENKLFIVMNEIYSPERRNFLEELKTTITDSMLPIEGKGIEEATLDNYANGMLFTNHKDGVPVTVDMRRYCILYMALQSYSDMIKAGMTPEYFSDLFNWMRGEKAYAHLGRDYGFRVMNDYLRDFPLVPELDPADLATRAPRSSSMAEAVRSSHGRAEQEILEAVAQGEPGFCGGWVSSVMLDRLLERKRVNLPVNKRRAVMISLGYDYHPALQEGRVNNVVNPDASKPRLYILMGSDAGKIDSPAEVAKNYTACQVESRLGS